MFLVRVEGKEPTYSLVLQKHIPLHINFLYQIPDIAPRFSVLIYIFLSKLFLWKQKTKVVSHSKAAALFPCQLQVMWEQFSTPYNLKITSQATALPVIHSLPLVRKQYIL